MARFLGFLSLGAKIAGVRLSILYASAALDGRKLAKRLEATSLPSRAMAGAASGDQARDLHLAPPRW